MSKKKRNMQKCLNRVWIYCRTALKDEISLSYQKNMLIDFAKEQFWEIIGINAEHGSGMDFNRKGLKEVTEVVEAERIDIVLVKSSHQIRRNTYMIMACVDQMNCHGVKLMTADNGEVSFQPSGVAIYLRVASEKQLERHVDQAAY